MGFDKWSPSRKIGPYYACEYRKLWSAWTFAQSDHGFHVLALEVALNQAILTLVLLNPDIPQANWSGSALFAIKYVNL